MYVCLLIHKDELIVKCQLRHSVGSDLYRSGHVVGKLQHRCTLNGGEQITSFDPARKNWMLLRCALLMHDNGYHEKTDMVRVCPPWLKRSKVAFTGESLGKGRHLSSKALTMEDPFFIQGQPCGLGNDISLSLCYVCKMYHWSKCNLLLMNWFIINIMRLIKTKYSEM